MNLDGGKYRGTHYQQAMYQFSQNTLAELCLRSQQCDKIVRFKIVIHLYILVRATNYFILAVNILKGKVAHLFSWILILELVLFLESGKCYQ